MLRSSRWFLLFIPLDVCTYLLYNSIASSPISKSIIQSSTRWSLVVNFPPTCRNLAGHNHTGRFGPECCRWRQPPLLIPVLCVPVYTIIIKHCYLDASVIIGSPEPPGSNAPGFPLLCVARYL